MPAAIFRNANVRSVVWRDLVPLSWRHVVQELLLPLPWLAGSLLLAASGLYPVALLFSFVFFLTGLRQVHNAYHYALGISRSATELVMFVFSVLMLGSMHAVQFNHLLHHKHCLDDEDVEGMCARMPAWLALLIGPWFPLRMHVHALRYGNRRQRTWIAAELAANVLWITLALFVWDVPVLRYHITAMAIGQCLTGFFAVWTVHHDCERENVLARTQRGWLKNWLSFSMFFHLEHHLFPKVPTCRLAELARRLDAAAPELHPRQVIG